MPSELPKLFFETPEKWRSWLEKHHRQDEGIWLRFHKKASELPTMTYEQALDEALCFGWIDGLVHAENETSYLQKFTPRRAKSVWSKINTQHIARLTKEGKMHEAGIAAVEAAKADGRWQNAYESPKNMKVPEDFLQELKKHPKALTFFSTLSKANTFAIAYQLHNAKKPETRERRMKKFIAMLEKQKKIH